MTARELAFAFRCRDTTSIAILHLPEQPSEQGLLVIPGAPQYRVGSHRQFVSLGRTLAHAGIPVMRVDYRGMGDSDGDFRSFEEVADDLDAAISEMMTKLPSLKRVVLWGFCDGASASCFYGASDPRVAGMVLINPWVRDETTVDRAVVRHYYIAQLRSGAFWRRLASGRIHVRQALADLLRRLYGVARRRLQADANAATSSAPSDLPLYARVMGGLVAFRGRVLLILSGADLTAQEFEESVLKAPAMVSWLSSADCQVLRLDGANHTYSSSRWRQEVHQATIAWLHADTARNEA